MAVVDAFALARAVAELHAALDGGAFGTIAERAPAWQRDALCVEYPRLEWFPAVGQPSTAAKDVCGRCAVAEECLAYAVENSIDSGVWGGTAPHERRGLIGARERRPRLGVADRDEAIQQARAGGASLAELGRRWGLTRQRVAQICAAGARA